MEDKIFAIVTFAYIVMPLNDVIEIVGRCTFDKIVGWWILR